MTPILKCHKLQRITSQRKLSHQLKAFIIQFRSKIKTRPLLDYTLLMFGDNLMIYPIIQRSQLGRYEEK